ncbi:MAG: hypothetical protein ABI947_14955 [Chloroflexota bacterium]
MTNSTSSSVTASTAQDNEHIQDEEMPEGDIQRINPTRIPLTLEQLKAGLSPEIREQLGSVLDVEGFCREFQPILREAQLKNSQESTENAA